MQDHAIKDGKLIYDIAEVIKGQVTIVFPGEQGARTLLAQLVATARRLDINRARQSSNPNRGHGRRSNHTNSFIIAEMQAAVVGASVGLCCNRSARRWRSDSSSISKSGSSNWTTRLWRR